MKKNLTDRFLSTLKAPSGGNRLEYTDTKTKGLAFRVTPSGVKSWALRYRDRHGKQHRITLGDYPTLTLQAARDMAGIKRGELLQGHDPKRKKISTVTDLVTEYDRLHIEKLRNAKQTRRLFETHITPKIGHFELTEVRRGDIREHLDKLYTSGLRAQVNRVQAAISAAFNWAVDEGYMEINPIMGMRRHVQEKERDRALSDDELGKVWNAAAERSYPSREFIWLLILTGQRRDELRELKWKEIDEQGRAWTLPASRNKGKRTHVVPLCDFVWKIMEDIPRLGPYVFTVNGKKAYAGQSKLTPALIKASGVNDWTLHDLRRTARTGLSRLGVDGRVSELVINHAQGKLERTYDQYAFFDEKKAALQRWADHVRNVVLQDGEGADVISLAGREKTG